MPFCTNCGASCEINTRFCEDCGTSLSLPAKAKIPPIAQSTEVISSLSSGRKTMLSGALIALICFFLPWVKACGMSFSGFQIATRGATDSPGLGFLLLVPICAALIIWMILMKNRETMISKTDNQVLLATSIIPIIVLSIFYLKIKSELGGAPFEVFTFWFLLVYSAFVVAAVGTFLDSS